MKNFLNNLKTLKGKLAIAGLLLIVILAVVTAFSYVVKKQEKEHFQYEIVDFEKHLYIIYTVPKHETDTVIYFKLGDSLVTLSGNWSIKRSEIPKELNDKTP